MSAATSADLANLIRDIVELETELKTLTVREPDRYRIAPRPPATAADIATLRAAWKQPPPPSYVRLLMLHNGIDNFYWMDMPLLATADIAEQSTLADDYELSHLLLLMAAEWRAIGFDPTTADAEGEMAVAVCDKTGEHTRWPSLSAFLIGYRDRLAGWLADAKKDRAALDDD